MPGALMWHCGDLGHAARKCRYLSGVRDLRHTAVTELVSARVRARIDRDFPAPGSADEVSRLVAEASDSERIQAAMVLWAGGSVERVLDSVELARIDWRDVLVRGGLENEDWRDRLDAELGPNR